MKNYHEADEIKLVHSGDDYFNILEQIINTSRETIHLQTYIFEDDETGSRIADALLRAAARKVNVYVLLDAYGCYPFSKEMTKRFITSGVHFRLYSPLLSSESIYLGRRLHHKIIVADKKVALTGGINIANKYSGEDGKQPWLDYAVFTQGAICEYLDLICTMFYQKQNSQRPDNFEKKILPAKMPHRKLIRFRRNDWIRGKNEIYKSYLEAIISAKNNITIVASYFLPGNLFRRLLKEASERGVEIKIILAGKSDIPSLRQAERFMFEFYLKNNIGIYEWTNSVMHGKAMIVDNKWATIGSYNLNLLSHYISIELNTDIIDPGFVNTFTVHLQNIIKNNCNVVDLKKTSNNFTGIQKLKMWVAYHFYRIIMHAVMARRKKAKTR